MTKNKNLAIVLPYFFMEFEQCSQQKPAMGKEPSNLRFANWSTLYLVALADVSTLCMNSWASSLYLRIFPIACISNPG
jgi:hypothetical protein